MNRSTSAAITFMSRLAHLTGIQSCILATGDGLLVDTVGEVESPEETAAICTYILQSTRRLQQLDGYAHSGRLTLEGESSCVLIERLDDDNVLVISLTDSTNLNYIRWLLNEMKNAEQGSMDGGGKDGSVQTTLGES